MMAKVVRLLTKEHALIGLSIARIFFGIAILYQLIINIPIRYDLWGPSGLVPYNIYMEQGFITLFNINPSLWMVDIIVFGGIVICLLYIIGYKTRVIGVIMAILMFSLYMRNLQITHGGDNILRLLFVYLLFANVGAYFSVDSWLKKRNQAQGKQPSIFSRNETWNDLKAVFHNFAWIACVIQLIFMYFASGSYKIMGSMWQNGTALYYSNRVQEFFNPVLNPWLWEYEPVTIFMSYSTVLFQVAFPFLLLNRFTKYFAIISACILHLGIALFMGLVDFSWIMIGCEMILLTDTDYLKLATYWRNWRQSKQLEKSETQPA